MLLIVPHATQPGAVATGTIVPARPHLARMASTCSQLHPGGRTISAGRASLLVILALAILVWRFDASVSARAAENVVKPHRCEHFGAISPRKSKQHLDNGGLGLTLVQFSPFHRLPSPKKRAERPAACAVSAGAIQVAIDNRRDVPAANLPAARIVVPAHGGNRRPLIGTAGMGADVAVGTVPPLIIGTDHLSPPP